MRKVIYKLANGKVTTNYAEAVVNGNYQLALETIPEAPLRMSEKMRNRVLKNYTEDIVHNRYIEVIEKYDK